MERPAPDFDSLCAAYSLGTPAAVQTVGDRVWRLSTAAGDVAVKVFDPGEADGAVREARLLAHLAECHDPRFRVQTLLRSADSGSPLVETEQHCVLLTRWEAGRAKPYSQIAAEEWRALGSSLAALHLGLESLRHDDGPSLTSMLKAFDADDECRRIADARDPVARQQRIAPSGLQRYLDQRIRLIETCAAGAIGNCPDDQLQQPIHNDYNQFNYLFGDTLPPVILDWESSIDAPCEFEVVRCLNHLPIERSALALAFVRSYLEVRPLRADAMAWAVDSALLMHALKHWPLERWLRDPTESTDHLQGAIRMVDALIDERTRLVDFFAGSVETPA